MISFKRAGVSAIVLLSAFSLTTSADEDSIQVRSSELALVRALEYTGFGELRDWAAKGAESLTKPVTYADSTTPFLGTRMAGRAAWQVTFDSIRLDIPGYYPSVVANQIPKTFDVYIDKQSGELLQIVSRYDGRDSLLRAEPLAEQATADLALNETWHALVAEPPAVSFLQALRQADLCNPILAKQVIGVCVVLTSRQVKSRPVWSILSRGTPPYEAAMHARVPVFQRNRARCLVDAVTGDLIGMALNSPAILNTAEPSEGD